MMRLWIRILFGLFWFEPHSSLASPEIGVSGGTRFGNDIYMARVVYTDKLKYKYVLGSGRVLQPFWELSGGGWRGTGVTEDGISFVAVRYILRTPLAGFRNTYLDVGIGPVLMDDYQLGDRKGWGHKLQFDSHLGVVHFFRKNPYYFGYRIQHISNGGLRSPNPGVNFHTLSIGRRF